MSISTIKVIAERILAASPKSKIAVFRSKDAGFTVFDAVFDSTVDTQKRIKNFCPDYIGSYYGIEGAKTATKVLNREA